MFLWHVNNLLKLKLLSPCSPLAGAGGGGIFLGGETR